MADEINGAPAKVQSALLEAMQEKQVTIGENTYKLEEPFLVLATQNPIEQEGLNTLEMNWGKKYPYAVKSWITNWEGLTAFIAYPLEIRKIIYTTNIIENLNRNIRRYTKTKSMFPDDNAVKKAVYLAIQHASFSWQRKVTKWPMIANQLNIIYPDRFKPNIASL